MVLYPHLISSRESLYIIYLYAVCLGLVYESECYGLGLHVHLRNEVLNKRNARSVLEALSSTFRFKHSTLSA